MLFTSAFKKDFSSTAGAAFVALFSIIITITLVRTLGQVAGGKVEDADIVVLILLGGVQYLPAVIVLTAFVAVMGVVSRAFREQEMTAWMASGLSLKSLINPVLRFSLPLTLLALVCSVWLSPWSRAETVSARDRFANRSDVSKVSAGQFRESSDGKRIFFVQEQNEAATEVRNVFVADYRDAEVVVLSASSGSVQDDPNGQRYLVLKDGRRFELDYKAEVFTGTDFETYGLAIKTSLGSTPDLRLKQRDIQYVLAEDSPEARGELLWRLSLPLSALTLSLLAIPLAFVNPRGGRSLNQIFALLIYLTYSNLISMTQTMVVKETVNFWLAFALPHVCVLALFVVMLYRRQLPAGASWFRLSGAVASRSKGKGGES